MCEARMWQCLFQCAARAVWRVEAVADAGHPDEEAGGCRRDPGNRLFIPHRPAAGGPGKRDEGMPGVDATLRKALTVLIDAQVGAAQEEPV
jgi:hypothetical protein